MACCNWAIVIFVVPLVFGQAPPTEVEAVKTLARKYGAKVEVALFDGSRVDLLSKEYAIEADWAHKSLKWAEGIGQALYYAEMTGRDPAVLLLVPSGKRYDAAVIRNIHRCKWAARRAKVKVFLEYLE